MKHGDNRRDVNRRIRQDAERDRLIANGHLSQVIENTKKLQTLEVEMDSVAVQRLKAANDVHLKLIGKYLPDLKAMELSQDPENPLFEMSRDERQKEIDKLLAAVGRGAGKASTATKGASGTH